MYSYTYDEKTGGLILNSSPTTFSKEPRPVYAPELDILGLNKYWQYDKQSEFPYMWAEANTYWYRGMLVAKLKGGNLYTAPEVIIPTDEKGNYVTPELYGNALRTIDINGMNEANREMLEIIESTTVKKILAVYEKYKYKVDLFHVAYSGGKDSAVLLDLVKKALPKGSYVVVFGDTEMEFPDTYDIIEKTRITCKEEEIPFYTAKSHIEPKKSWELFGPPSRVLRWCCSVHKSTPQTLKLREISLKKDFIGLDFVGVRSHESFSRSEYDYENYSKKQKGQFSHNSILEWTSAEVWLHIYANNISINEAYKKGNSRAGCLFCPMSGDISNFMRRSSYINEINEFCEIVTFTYDNENNNKSKVESYLLNGGWNSRKNGRELKNNLLRCIEKMDGSNFRIKLINPNTDWTEWMKTMGSFELNNENASVKYGSEKISFNFESKNDEYNISVDASVLAEQPYMMKIFRQVFRKAAYCSACKVCESNCRYGRIKFDDGKITVSNCNGCHECHLIDSGCIVFHSLRHPQGGGRSLKSLNSFADHAPKYEWLHSYFEKKEGFFAEHTLGPMMFDMFRRFLRDAGLNEKNHFTPFAKLISQIGWEKSASQGLILINLVAENPQLEWYVKNFDIGCFYTRENVENMLIALGVKAKDAKSIAKAFKRITTIPLGTILNFGHVTDDGDLVRTKCYVSDPRVILYGLYKFAEKCNNYKEFTLATLLNDNIERDGVSPTRIFGFDREDMTPILIGLSAKYPEFISASFTHDLEKVTLAEDKTSMDVLELFKEDLVNAN